jgi:hypothetical protein
MLNQGFSHPRPAISQRRRTKSKSATIHRNNEIKSSRDPSWSSEFETIGYSIVTDDVKNLSPRISRQAQDVWGNFLCHVHYRKKAESIEWLRKISQLVIHSKIINKIYVWIHPWSICCGSELTSLAQPWNRCV